MNETSSEAKTQRHAREEDAKAMALKRQKVARRKREVYSTRQRGMQTGEIVSCSRARVIRPCARYAARRASRRRPVNRRQVAREVPHTAIRRVSPPAMFTAKFSVVTEKRKAQPAKTCSSTHALYGTVLPTRSRCFGERQTTATPAASLSRNSTRVQAGGRQPFS